MSEADQMAWRRSSEIVLELISRGVPARRLWATVPAQAEAARPTGVFTFHPMPSTGILDNQSYDHTIPSTTSIVVRNPPLTAHAGILTAQEPELPAEYQGYFEQILVRLDSQLLEAQQQLERLCDDASNRLPLSPPIKLIALVNQVGWPCASGCALPCRMTFCLLAST